MWKEHQHELGTMSLIPDTCCISGLTTLFPWGTFSMSKMGLLDCIISVTSSNFHK